MYNRLKKLREKYSYTTKEISENLDISEELYSKYEFGEKKIPIEILSKIAKMYNTSIDYIVGDTNEIKAYKKRM